jgi:hypothetical protein
MKNSLGLAIVLISPSSVAMADFNLANNQKKVVCYADDNQSWVLSANRKTIKYTVEGESLGVKKITKTATDGDTVVSYKTSVGTLYLDDQGDRYIFAGETEAASVDCN